SPTGAADALPGVRQSALFEINRKSGLDEDDDIDVHEAGEPVRVASAAGLARLAPNGLIKQTDRVDVGCLKPSLVRVLRRVEQHFGKKLIVTSGYRSPARNRRARGARNSLHMYCAAADVQVPGVSKAQLARFVRAMPGRGGVGTYCHTKSVHIDVGPERDWNWRCRRRR
ncbi:MAG: D-Ala-D-Ala carboxypeptidase family metallohydrolase, partial [Nitratireductor sp.]